ncbi:hypothetical protein DOTSEDRAFT_54955 [Dothistroma septosporum NZE10]|uniref:DUF998 domain-containing protein n=1 Tax=Dothistroma septosporum (strain NZE10 / CBS 128990) TaxID=675120 RepID=N1PKM9_DOTSN|nr:hypothetical protein DOTSEDRAFT_54955 [Dothistroma septosporum NZE10]
MSAPNTTRISTQVTLSRQDKPLAITAAAIFLLLPIIYLSIEYYAALSYIPYYSYLKNHTSDLGIPYAFINPMTGAQIYSYQAQLMRLNFVLNGFLYYIGHTVLLQATTSLTGGKYNIPRAIVSVVYCIGIVLVAAVPAGPGEKKDGYAIWHNLGAFLAIGGANANILLAGLAAPSTRQPVYRGLCLLLGTLGSAGLAIFLIIFIAKNGSGMSGFWQRSSIYPNQLWEFITGLHLMYLLKQTPSMGMSKRE